MTNQSAIERIIRPIVEGQIMDFLQAHPEVLIGVTRHRPHGKTQSAWVKDSLSKRIVRDLTCESSVARLESALLARATDTQGNDGLSWVRGSSAAEIASPTVSADSCWTDFISDGMRSTSAQPT